MDNIEKLIQIMASLRDPETGCPWDKEQTLASIVPHTIEEAYEIASAIECGDLDELRDELGDLLFHIVFYSRLTSEQGQFSFDDVAKAAIDKIVRRHPHVFGGETTPAVDQQQSLWEQKKAIERQQKLGAQGKTISNLDGIASALPALIRAVKLQNRAAHVGFDWPDVQQVFDKLAEEIEELRSALKNSDNQAAIQHELGDILLAVSNLSRHIKIDPETALREANHRFERRFRRVESLLTEQGIAIQDATLSQMEAQWQQAKCEERSEATNV